MSILNSVSGRVKLQENKLAEEKAKPDEFAEEQPEKINPPIAPALSAPVNESPALPEPVHSRKKKSSIKSGKKKPKPKKKSKR